MARAGPTALTPNTPAAVRSPLRIAARRDVAMAPPHCPEPGEGSPPEPGLTMVRPGTAGDIFGNSPPESPGRVRAMNRLADETSPYLRQHKDNPVDWYPWGDEAFARA